MAVTRSCSFDDAVGEALRLFPNVPEIKEKQKKCLKLLLKRKDPSGFGTSLIYLACVAIREKAEKPSMLFKLTLRSRFTLSRVHSLLSRAMSHVWPVNTVTNAKEFFIHYVSRDKLIC